MQAAIVANGAFTYTAEIRPLAWPAGGFHFSVHSQWDGAKDPLATRAALQLTTDREGLLALRELIDRALEDAPPSGSPAPQEQAVNDEKRSPRTTVYSVYTDEPIDMGHPLFMARAQARIAAGIMFERRMPLVHAIRSAIRDIRVIIPDVPPSLVAATIAVTYFKLQARDWL